MRIMEGSGATPLCGAVVSDLRLFTNRTTVHEHMLAIRRAAEECSLFVFNGDSFDFKRYSSDTCIPRTPIFSATADCFTMPGRR